MAKQGFLFFQLVAGLGFEPRQAESESAVLPLLNPAGEMKWLKGHLSE